MCFELWHILAITQNTVVFVWLGVAHELMWIKLYPQACSAEQQILIAKFQSDRSTFETMAVEKPVLTNNRVQDSQCLWAWAKMLNGEAAPLQSTCSNEAICKLNKNYRQCYL